MQRLIFGMAAVACATGLAVAAETKYVPHHAGGATQVAFQSEGDDMCSKDREVLACVVQLGPNQSDRWAYMLRDETGAANTDVKYTTPRTGAPCAAMAYPVGNVVIAGGMGEWFNGKVERACRH
jgi:hypothetical protein